MNASVGEERLLRAADVAAVVGVSRAYIYHLMKQGTFPRPIALSRNCARWVHSEVQTWVHERIGTARVKAPIVSSSLTSSEMGQRRGRPRGRPSAA
ncbi:AlpA family phage regulatory protein [Luteitalea sp.]|uniref:helix-turn-helix transcriptional regulator n=1 Tax=Luteitalea sp. TaxID=2004800 RepID=UPI003457A6A6